MELTFESKTRLATILNSHQFGELSKWGLFVWDVSGEGEAQLALRQVGYNADSFQAFDYCSSSSNGQRKYRMLVKADASELWYDIEGSIPTSIPKPNDFVSCEVSANQSAGLITPEQLVYNFSRNDLIEMANNYGLTYIDFTNATALEIASEIVHYKDPYVHIQTVASEIWAVRIDHLPNYEANNYEIDAYTFEGQDLTADPNTTYVRDGIYVMINFASARTGKAHISQE